MKSILLFTVLIFFAGQIVANNIAVSNVTLTGHNTVAGLNNPANYVMVQFSVNWENSWRSSFGPGNWDAAWLFIKYRVSGGDWKHASLNNIGHTAPAGSTIDAGLLTPYAAFNSVTNPGIGAFIYRNTNGSGTFTATNLQLRWNYGAQSIPDNTAIEVQAFAVEMVYVPQGAFNAGGGGGSGSFTSTTINTTIMFVPPSGSGSLGGQAGGYPTGQLAPSNGWPNGFAAIYCMKYEISQQQYVDFLNTLTRGQQGGRVASDITGTSVTNRYVMSGLNFVNLRSAICCNATIPASPVPVTFYCDLSGNSIGSEANDGQWIACNYINGADVAAFLDWSGLRPMTELEFEKICRGTLLPVAGEFAWGSTIVTGATGISNSGTASETASNAGANVSYNSLISGPMRVGNFAGAATNRIQSGASYYGAMELSGNIWERGVVTIGNLLGRGFTGLHGNGTIGVIGVADVLNWPGADGTGSGFRGGSNANIVEIRISDRTLALFADNTRYVDAGGRGVRSAP